MTNLSLSHAWDETKAILARDGNLLGTVALALVVLPQAIYGAFFAQEAQLSPVSQLVGLAVILIGLAAQLALNRLAIGPSTTVGAAIGRGAARTPAALATFLIVIVAMSFLFLPVAMLLVSIGVLEAAAAAGTLPPPRLLGIFLVYFLFVFSIFQLIVPIAAAERGGPLHILARSWKLGIRQYWRLFTFLIFVLIGLLVVWLTGQLLAGIFTSLALGPPRAGSLSAALLSLIVAAAQGAYTMVSAVMLARIYAQLAGGGTVQASVPRSGT
ncbi:MAG TPA: hypothetical protein VFY95_03910 [Sphingomicrobium sp.]